MQDYFSAAARHFAELLTCVCWDSGSCYSRTWSEAAFAAKSDGGGLGVSSRQPHGDSLLVSIDDTQRRHTLLA